jgi:hypothetical protein
MNRQHIRGSKRQQEPAKKSKQRVSILIHVLTQLA